MNGTLYFYICTLRTLLVIVYRSDLSSWYSSEYSKIKYHHLWICDTQFLSPFWPRILSQTKQTEQELEDIFNGTNRCDTFLFAMLLVVSFIFFLHYRKWIVFFTNDYVKIRVFLENSEVEVKLLNWATTVFTMLQVFELIPTNSQYPSFRLRIYIRRVKNQNRMWIVKIRDFVSLVLFILRYAKGQAWVRLSFGREADIKGTFLISFWLFYSK